MRRRNDAQFEDLKNFPPTNHHERQNKFERFSKILEGNNNNFEDKQKELIEELNKLKSEMQGFSPSSDDEPELTQKKSIKVDNNEILSCLIEDNKNQDSIENKLQQLLDNTMDSNQRIMFADKNNQIWEIVKQDDLMVDQEQTLVQISS